MNASALASLAAAKTSASVARRSAPLLRIGPPRANRPILFAALGDKLTIHGPSDALLRGGVISFAFADLHPHDISQVLDEHAVCVRAGHHCAKPLMRQLGVPATTRASLYVYNDEADVDVLVEALAKAQKFFTP